VTLLNQSPDRKQARVPFPSYFGGTGLLNVIGCNEVGCNRARLGNAQARNYADLEYRAKQVDPQLDPRGGLAIFLITL